MRTLILLPLAALLACAGSKNMHSAAPHASGESQPHASSLRRWVTVYDPSLGSHVEVRNFHWSEVRSKAKVAPKYPSEAKKLGINGRCQVRFLIDGSGNQVNLELLETDDCPPVFHKNTLKAANRWRFKPLEADGIAVRATFVLGLRFIAK